MLKGKWLSVLLCGAVLLGAGCSAQATTAAEEPDTQEAPAATQAASEEADAPAASEQPAAETAAPAASAAETPEAASLAETAAPTASPAPTGNEEKAVSSAAAKAAPTSTPAATATPAPAAATAEPATAPAEAATLETALQYVGGDVARLYAAVGQPISAEYASSCMGDGEDGILTYETFTVTTYREGGVETVQDAY